MLFGVLGGRNVRPRTEASLLGGAVGIVIAAGASYFLAGLMHVVYSFDATINLSALIFSVGIGVVFGYFPARRAWTALRRFVTNSRRTTEP